MATYPLDKILFFIAKYSKQTEQSNPEKNQSLRSLYQLLKPISETENNDPKSLLSKLEKALREANRIITLTPLNNGVQKINFQKNKKSLKNNLKNLIEQMERELLEALNLISFISIIKHQSIPNNPMCKGGSDVLWISSNPMEWDMNDITKLGINIIMKVPNKALSFIKKNPRLLGKPSTKFRIVIFLTHHDQPFAEELIQEIREQGYLTPILIHCEDYIDYILIQAKMGGIIISTSIAMTITFIKSMNDSTDDHSSKSSLHSLNDENYRIGITKNTQNKKIGYQKNYLSTPEITPLANRNIRESMPSIEDTSLSLYISPEASILHHKILRTTNGQINNFALNYEITPLKPSLAQKLNQEVRKSRLSISMNQEQSLDPPLQSSSINISAKTDKLRNHNLSSHTVIKEPSISNISEIPIQPKENLVTSQKLPNSTPKDKIIENALQTIVGKPIELNSPPIFQSNKIFTNDCSVIGIGSKYYSIGKINTFEIYSLSHRNLLVHFSGCSISFEGLITEIDSGIYLVEYFPTRSTGPYQVNLLSDNILLHSFTINPLEPKSQQLYHSPLHQSQFEKPVEKSINLHQTQSQIQQSESYPYTDIQYPPEEPEEDLFSDIELPLYTPYEETQNNTILDSLPDNQYPSGIEVSQADESSENEDSLFACPLIDEDYITDSQIQVPISSTNISYRKEPNNLHHTSYQLFGHSRSNTEEDYT